MRSLALAFVISLVGGCVDDSVPDPDDSGDQADDPGDEPPPPAPPVSVCTIQKDRQKLSGFCGVPASR